MFQSRLVLTKGYLEDIEAGTFQSRGTFGTAVRGWPKMFPPKKKGLDEEPEELPLISKIVGNGEFVLSSKVVDSSVAIIIIVEPIWKGYR